MVLGNDVKRPAFFYEHFRDPISVSFLTPGPDLALSDRVHNTFKKFNNYLVKMHESLARAGLNPAFSGKR